MGEDEQYYRAFLDGDEKGFENLVIKYKNNLIYFILRYVNDFSQAEDLAQDAFVEVLLHKERYHFKTGFKTYLFTIGRNKAVDFIRKNKRQIPLEEMENSAGEEAGLLDMVLEKENRALVSDVMKRLKNDYYMAIWLVDFEELSYQEAAKVLKKTLPQIKVLVHRARKALKRELEKEGYGYED